MGNILIIVGVIIAIIGSPTIIGSIFGIGLMHVGMQMNNDADKKNKLEDKDKDEAHTPR